MLIIIKTEMKMYKNILKFIQNLLENFAFNLLFKQI